MTFVVSRWKEQYSFKVQIGYTHMNTSMRFSHMTFKESTLCFTTSAIACLAAALLRDESRALASPHRAMVLYHRARPCAPLQRGEYETF